MIVGVDASKLLATAKTGVEVSTTELIRALLKLDTENTYWLYSQSPINGIEFNERIKNVVVPGQRLWTLRALSSELKQRKPDIFWSPANFLPNNLPAKSVGTIHDLAFYLYPQSYPLKQRLLSLYTLKRAIKASAKLIAVSQQTKKDLKRYFNIPGENIEVIYHALRTDFGKPEIDLSVTYPGLNKYFIYVGRLELRKNLPNVIRAFVEFQKQTNEPVQLLLGGSRGYGYNRIIKLIKQLRAESSVIVKDYLPAEHLPTLYKKSLGLIFASQYEGFGLNILEGFAAGVPVITSDLGSMAEVAGGAALLVDPDDIDALSSGMLKLFNDPNLRQALIEKGKVRLAEFSWGRSAEKLMALWKNL
jgi:glycosyltransferase involved in cell wall biosynthesis